MMNDLERYISRNREAFEEDLPSDHLRQFEQKMRNRRNTFLHYKKAISMAAIFILMITAGSVLYFSNPEGFKSFFANPLQSSPLPEEIKTAMTYYNTMTSNNVKQINSLNLSTKEKKQIQQYAGKALQQYDNNAQQLRKQLNRYPDNETIKRALIENQMKKNEFIKRILKQVNETNTKKL